MFKGSRALPILSLPPPDLQAWTQKGLQTVFAHAQASVALFHSNKWSRTLKPSFTLLTPHNIQYEAGIIRIMVSVGCIYHLACKISWNQDFTANTVQKWSSSWDRPMTEWNTQKKIIINRNERFPFAVLLPGHCKTGFSWTVAMQQLISVLERRRFWAEKQTPTNINKSVDLWSCTCFNITKGILQEYDLIISTHSLCAWFIICRDLFMFTSMEAYSNSHAQSQAGGKISFQSFLSFICQSKVLITVSAHGWLYFASLSM